MIVNSTKISLTNKVRIIDLFAGIGGLSNNVYNTYKNNSIRMSVGRDDFLWKLCSSIEDEEEVFYNIWEEDTIGITPQRSIKTKFDMSKNTRLAKAVLTQSIVRYFRKRDCPVKKDFIGRIEVWMKTQEDEKSISYQRYTIQPRLKDQCDGWQLDIAEGRISVVSKTPTKDVADLPEEGYDVICNHCIIPVRKIEQRHWTATNGQFYPVVNGGISRIVGIKTSYKRDTNKFANKLAAAQSFLDNWICTDDFRQEVGVTFPDGNNFISLQTDKVMMVDDEAKELVYGDSANGKAPRSEFRSHGPYRRPDVPFTYFFINKDDSISNSYRMRLFNILQYAKDYAKCDWSNATPEEKIKAKTIDKPIADYLLQRPKWESGLSCIYKSDQTAIYEIRKHLQSSRFHKDQKYIAIIISDIHRDDQNKEKHELYYLMKELLMQYGITSQVIYRNNINDPSFKWFIPNIAAALVGKMGGMAWGVKSLVKGNDMIVGIGACKQKGIKKPYLGSAFCFDKDGSFRNFNSCRADDKETLQSDLKKSILHFCNDYGKPDRLIIHYYKKKLKREESEQIESMLRQCDIDCPIYVVNVVTASNEDLIAFDLSQNDKMPMSGTYIHLRNCEYLLYNNEKYSSNSKAEKLYPIKLTISNGTNNGTSCADAKVVREIITQVYQFCRLYWKSVKMQNVPITIAYPELVAKYVPHFSCEELPEFGRNNLWML